MGDEQSASMSSRGKKRATHDVDCDLRSVVLRLERKVEKLAESVEAIKKNCIVIPHQRFRNHTSEKKGADGNDVQCPVCGNHTDILKVGFQELLKHAQKVNVDIDTDDDDEDNDDGDDDDDEEEEDEEEEEEVEEQPEKKKDVMEKFFPIVDGPDLGHTNSKISPSLELENVQTAVRDVEEPSEGFNVGVSTSMARAKSESGRMTANEDVSRPREDCPRASEPRKRDTSSSEMSSLKFEKGSTRGRPWNSRTRQSALNFSVVSSCKTDEPVESESLSVRRPIPYKYLRKTETKFDDDNRNGYRHVYVHYEEDQVPTPAVASSREANIAKRNQLLTPSQLKNYHGSDDNRHRGEALGGGSYWVLQASMSLSNRNLVLNGPRKSQVTVEEHSTPFGPDTNGGLVTDAFLSSLIQTNAESAERCEDVKSQGIDTAICLDLSGSMAGEPLEKAKLAIRRLLDGFEMNSIEYELEENVALVTFGKENAIRQHLTNNYDFIRNQLDNLTTGETSPLWLGLALSLTEITKRGGNITLNHVTVRPRIIVISDGFVTEKQKLYGVDVMNSNDMANQEIQELHDLLVSKWDILHGIDCLLVNPNSCQDILAKVSNNRVFRVEHVDYLVEHFRVQMALDTYLENIKTGKHTHDQVKDELQTTDFHSLSKEEVSKIIDTFKSKDQEKAHTLRQQEGTKTRTGQAMVADVEELERTKVNEETQSRQEVLEQEYTHTQTVTSEERFEKESQQRTPDKTESTLHKATEGSSRREQQARKPDDWENANSTSARPKLSSYLKQHDMSIQPIKEDTMPLDHTDFAETNTNEAPAEEEIDNVDELIFATPVKADPNWEQARKRRNQIGKVIGNRQNGYIPIVWDNGEEEKCRYGLGGHYDVKPTEEKYVDNSIMRIGAVVERGPDWKWKDQDGGVGSHGVVTKIDGNVVYVLWIHGVRGNYSYGYRKKYHVKLVEKVKEPTATWQVCDPKGIWRPFPADLSLSTEEMFEKSPGKVMLVKIQGKSCKINLKEMNMTDLQTQAVHQIRRLDPGSP